MDLGVEITQKVQIFRHVSILAFRTCIRVAAAILVEVNSTEAAVPRDSFAF